MLPETMLEYLTLREVCDTCLPASWETLNSNDNRGWFTKNHERFYIDIEKLKDRLTELEKMIINPYVIDNPA